MFLLTDHNLDKGLGLGSLGTFPYMDSFPES